MIRSDSEYGVEYADAPQSVRQADRERRVAAIDLLNDLDELVRYIAMVDTPEVDAVRGRLYLSLAAAKQRLLHEDRAARETAHGGTFSAGGLAQGYPWIALGVGALLGAALGMLAAARQARRRRVNALPTPSVPARSSTSRMASRSVPK